MMVPWSSSLRAFFLNKAFRDLILHIRHFFLFSTFIWTNVSSVLKQIELSCSKNGFIK